MISNKRIWIIGAGSGIGRELALQLAHAGNVVAVSGRGIEALNEVAAAYSSSAESSAGSVIPYACDVTDESHTTSVAANIIEATGGLDILVFCAGRCEYVDDAELSTELFKRVYDVNVFGMVNAIRAVLPAMKSLSPVNKPAADKPQIVGVASLSALLGLPRAEAYGSSKAAAIYLLNSLRLNLTQYNVDVTVVNPGFVETPMTASNDFPMPYLMQVDEAAECIVRGVAKRKRTVNFPWRLTFALKFAALFPSLWYGVVGPKLARQSTD